MKIIQRNNIEATLFKQLQQIHLYNCKIWMVHFKLEIPETVLKILQNLNYFYAAVILLVLKT